MRVPVSQEFDILRSASFRWLLALFGATRARSKVRLEATALDVHFGPFHERIPFSNVVSAERVPLKWWQHSIGWRTNLKGGVGLIGDSTNVVRLSLAQPMSVRLMPLVRATCQELFISMEAPGEFLAALAPRIARKTAA